MKQEILQTVENKKTELHSLNDKYKKAQEDLKKTQDEIIITQNTYLNISENFKNDEIEAEDKRRKEL